MSAADISRTRLERAQAQHDLEAITKLNSTGAASQGEVAAARQRLETAESNLHALGESAKAATPLRRWSGLVQRFPKQKPTALPRARYWPRLRFMQPYQAQSIA